MKKLLSLAIVFIFSFSLFAQEESKSSENRKDFGLTVNYFGELEHHSGVEIGIESTVFKNIITVYQVGFYFVESDRVDLSLYWEMGYRKAFKFGYSPEVRVGIGYLSTYVPENILEGKEVLEIVYMPSITIGALGWDLREAKNIPLRFFGNVMIYWAKPVGKAGENNVAFKTGATFFF